MKALALLFALPLFAPLMPGTSAAPFIAQDAGQDVERPLSEQVDELFADNDFDALVTLWKAHEVRALSTIDRDLEGSLAIWEAAQKREAKLRGRVVDRNDASPRPVQRARGERGIRPPDL